ncbi:twin-arginine translocase subunit TatC [Candidatus Ichthyocystis hellenicum]|uniref:twin-arginine translocase subunit TatC n=1 Tax=Candidatus Ichthyocystis hellenicum TaxID=1561003 RepID=UPI000B19C18A|nr:twin-arginine translocase subunit TatC [Candidatus Ichthyocystis hellenicum]
MTAVRVVKMNKGFIPYIAELRLRIFYCLAVFIVVFLSIFSFRGILYSLLARPMMKLSPGGNLVSVSVMSSFWVPMKMAAFLSFVAAMPFFLWQFWAFVRPALYKHERKLTVFVVSVGYLLFLLGMLFVYFIVFPVLFAFVHKYVPSGLVLMTDVDQYWDFIYSCFLSFGCCFDLPVIMVILSYLGYFNEHSYVAYRRYAVVLSFVIAAVLSPPDVLSQCLLAVPLCALYELGIVLVRVLLNRRADVSSSSSTC